MTRSTLISLDRLWAMPSARAGRVSPRAQFHGLGHPATIAIAAWIYFGLQLMRGVL